MARDRNISNTQRNVLVQFLLEHCKGGKPLRGKMTEAANTFQVSTRQVSRYCAAAKQQKENGLAINLISAKQTCSRPKTVDCNLVVLQSLPLSKRSTLRRIAEGMKSKGEKCSKSTVWRWVKAKLLRSHSSAIKPDLTAPNKLLRLRFSLEAVVLDRMLQGFTFKSMHNVVHIDEKWFYMSKTTRRFYLTAEEADPYRSCQNKKFIKKVMFMCAVSRPIWNTNGQLIFDGKVGIFPFTHEVGAIRNSKKRPKGTLETKAIDSVNRDIIKKCLIHEILPAIKRKWPECNSKEVFIQQDNARPHIKDDDPDFRAAAEEGGWNIRLVHQPPNSPDMNVNDLGWFRALQSLQEETTCYSVDELMNAVLKSYEQLSPVTLNNVFLSLQGCMVEVMKVRGHNTYKLPHMNKAALIRQEQLPVTLEVSVELVQECIQYLIRAGEMVGIVEMQHLLGLPQTEFERLLQDTFGVDNSTFCMH